MPLELATGRPDARLGRMIRPFTGYAERTGGRLVRAEYPHGNVTVILSFGPAIDFPGLGGARPGSFASGLFTEPVLTGHDGFQQGVQLDLSPLLAGMVFGLPAAQLAGKVVELDDLLGAEGRDLPERLHDAPGWDERFAIVNQWLLRRLDRAPKPAPAVLATWSRLVATGGGASIAELAADLGWSRRHLSGRFTDTVGVSPKTYARILRFERARGLIAERRGAPLGQVALDAGYYDQAHLNRDFREFAHAPPTQLPFVQDEPAGAA
jgi:AraC-like DNA-binding protein